MRQRHVCEWPVHYHNQQGLKWENGQNAALTSYDFQTGAWQEWLGPEDRQVGLGQYPLVAIIPEH